MYIITSFGQGLDFCNFVMCWRILWHASVNLWSCMTYCEHYSNILFILIFSNKNVLYWGFGIRLIYAVRCKQLEVFCLELKSSIYNFVWKIPFKYIIIPILLKHFDFPFLSVRLYNIFCPSENSPCNKFTVCYNKHIQHSLSLTTLTTSSVLPTLTQLCYLQQFWALSLVS